MNIHDLHPSHRLDPQQNQQAGEARHVEPAHPGPSQGQEAQTSSEQIEDRVEISQEGREAQAQHEDAYPSIDFAKKALLDIPPLDPGRVEDIFKRIQAGYYSQPDVIKSTAQQITQEFTQVGPPEPTANVSSGPDPSTDSLGGEQ